ncbi:unnamed protein product [Onchocerca ochengi]|uniref:PAP-associated domain-containing protein n=1 Tax=Onchocerca ochengi TaxID=42157 RepID=A0A182EIQ4_ONCOC|nr:unnamed protein product [Onchocerca ochengi]
MTTKNEANCAVHERNLHNTNNKVIDIIQLDSSNESIEDDNARDDKFWQLMRACAQRKIGVHSYSFHRQQFYVVGSALLRSKAKTNLRMHLDRNDAYYDVGSVIQLCTVIKTSTYGVYLKRLSRHQLKYSVAVAEPIFRQLKPYLLGEMEKIPTAIDPNGPVPLLKETSLINDKRSQEKAAVSSTVASESAANEQMTIDGIEGEFFENPCYMEFLMNWLMHTNLECVKNTRTVKLTAEQKVKLNTTDENCHHVFMTINHLPASHFFGAGFGLDQKKAFWAASRSIVRRLYHAGFITPVLYHMIGKSGRSEFSGKTKRSRRMKEWRIVKNVIEWFRKTMTARMPHWVQLTKNGFNTEEFVKITDEVLSANRIIAQKHEMKLDGLVKRKRKADESKINLLEAKNFSCRKETEETKQEQEASFSNLLNVPSTSTALISDPKVNLYKKRKTTLKKDVNSAKDTFHILTKTAKATLVNNEDPSDNNCAMKTKSVFALKNGLIDNNAHGNLICYDGTDNADVILEEQEILPPVNIHTTNIPSPFPNNSGSSYGTLCLTLEI